MGKAIQVREEDSGRKGTTASILFVCSLIIGLGGVPVGKIAKGKLSKGLIKKLKEDVKAVQTSERDD